MLPPFVETKKMRPLACQHPSRRRNRAPPAASPSRNTVDKPLAPAGVGGSGSVMVTHSTGSDAPTA
jgi:hypothetical protein